MLIDDVKISLGLTGNTRNAEVQTLIEAAKEDMKRCGVVDGTEAEADLIGLRKHAIIVYAKANFGFDNPDMERMNRVYRQIVCDLINSND